MLISLSFYLFFILTFAQQSDKAIKGYDSLQIGPASGNYENSDYINNHKIPIDIFSAISNGDIDGYPLTNAFDVDSKTHWLSSQPETDSTKSSIYINFSKPILFEALLYDPILQTRNKIQYFDGFPHKLKIYTALDDEPLTLNTVFTGKPVNPWQRIQYVLSQPVKCNRLQIEFLEVTEATYFGKSEKLAASEGFTLLQSFDYGIVYYQKANGFYDDKNYITQHKIDRKSFTPIANSEDSSNKIENAFDDNSNTLWDAKQEESNDFKPTITVSFNDPVLLEGFIYEINFVDPTIGFDKLYGYPYQIDLYTSLNDEPLKHHTMFIGSPDKSWRFAKYVLTQPVKCTKILLKLSKICDYDKKGKIASAKEITFLQSITHNVVYYETLRGNYDNYNYNKVHKIKSFTPSANSEETTNKIGNAFDDNSGTLWNANQVESDDFKPTITIDFNSPVLFDGFIYELNYYKWLTTEKLYGFPYKIYLYTAFNDGPLTLNTVFIGSPEKSWRKVQYVLPEPVNCTKVQLELREISENEKKGKIASAKTITLLQSFNKDLLQYERATGDLDRTYYIEYHKVQSNQIEATYNGNDEVSNPIKNAFDDNSDTLWISKDAESDSFIPTITINLKNPVVLSALVYEINFYDGIKDYLYGFPSQVLVYTALENEPLTLNSIFIGSSETSWRFAQYVFSKPINCSKIKLELYGISNYDKKGNVASAKNIYLIQVLNENLLQLEQANEKYNDDYFMEKHLIPNTNYKLETTGDVSDKLIDNVNNEDAKKYWVAANENNDEYHANITATFDEAITIEAALLYATFNTKDDVRTFNGLPLKLNIYTSLNDEPLSLVGKYSGIPENSWDMIQVVFPEPVKCKKLMIEFVHVTKNTLFSNKKQASITKLKFIQDLQYEYYKFWNAEGIYTEANYILNHKEPIENMNFYSNGDLEDHPINNSFDGDTATSWVSPKDNDDNFHATIYIDFRKPIMIEAILYDGMVVKDGIISYHVTGFPEKIKIHSTINNKTQSFMFVGSSNTDYTRYQFVFPDPVACSHLELEFIQVTKEKKYSNDKYRALSNGITIISQKYEDFSSGNYTDDFSTIYIEKSSAIDKIADSNYVDLIVPNDNDYLFVVHKQFLFENVEFLCTKDKISAIKSELNPQVFIKKCIFNSCSVRNSQKNGGAINFINCALECTNSQFKNCVSKYGGGAYIDFRNPTEQSSLIKRCTFSNNEAACGGGMFLYSVIDDNLITIDSCAFKNNKIKNDVETSSPELTEGSAIFMKVKKGKVAKCKFVDNDQPVAVKIVNDFDDNLVTLDKDELTSLLFKDCEFEISSNSKSSLSFVNGDHAVPIYVSNCIFIGHLSKEAHHIDGFSMSRKNRLHLIHINSCKFSSDKKKSLNLNSIDIYDVNNHEFNFKYDNHIENPIVQSIKQFLLPFTIVISVFAVLNLFVLLLFKIKSNKNNDVEPFDVNQISI